MAEQQLQRGDPENELGKAAAGGPVPELIRFKVRASLNGLPTEDDKGKGKKGAKS